MELVEVCLVTRLRIMSNYILTRQAVRYSMRHRKRILHYLRNSSFVDHRRSGQAVQIHPCSTRNRTNLSNPRLRRTPPQSDILKIRPQADYPSLGFCCRIVRRFFPSIHIVSEIYKSSSYLYSSSYTIYGFKLFHVLDVTNFLTNFL